jgi:hypothetical protein
MAFTRLDKAATCSSYEWADWSPLLWRGARPEIPGKTARILYLRKPFALDLHNPVDPLLGKMFITPGWLCCVFLFVFAAMEGEG